MSTLLARHVGVAFNVDAVQTDLTNLSGLDRYETITWRIVSNQAGENGLLVEAHPKPYGPPFLMLGLNLENTTSQDFRVTFTGRYLGYDLVGSGSEVRIDATIGSDLALAAALAGRSAPARSFSSRTGVSHQTFELIQNEAIVAEYGETFTRGSERRHESGTAERFAHRRISRPAGRHGPGRRSRAACGQRRRDGRRNPVADELAGQPGYPRPRHLRVHHAAAFFRRARRFPRRSRVSVRA